VRKLPERLIELLGYSVCSPFINYVDGRHPKRLLLDGNNPKLHGVVCNDEPSCWERAGFKLNQDGQCLFAGSFQVRFARNGAFGAIGQGLLGWIWSGIDSIDIGGIATIVQDHPRNKFQNQVHPNGIIGVDHVVLMTNHVDETILSFEKFGITLKKKQEVNSREGERSKFMQAFFRPSHGTIVEVVGPTPEHTDKQAPVSAFLWGMTFVSENLEQTKQYLGDKLSNIRNAKQHGRKIATLRHKAFDIHVSIAIMSPHISSSSL